MGPLNVAYGSFNKSKNFTELMEYASDLVVKCDPDDAVLVKLWPWICQAMGWKDAEHFTKEARKRFVADLPASKTCTVKGQHCTPSKFHSIAKGWRFWRPEIPTKAFVLTHLAKDKGWAAHWEDLFTTSPAFVPSWPSSTGDGGPASSSAASGSAGPDPAPPTSMAKAKLEAKQRKERMMAKSVNSFHYVARILCDIEFVKKVDTAVLYTAPLDREHSKHAEGDFSEETMMKYFADMAAGEWRKPLWDIIKLMENLTELGQLGFTVEFSERLKKDVKTDDAWVQAEDAEANAQWLLVCHVLSERCVTMAPHDSAFPEALGGLNSTDETAVENALKSKRSWMAYAEGSHQTAPAVLELVRKSCWKSPGAESCSRVARAEEYRSGGLW